MKFFSLLLFLFLGMVANVRAQSAYLPIDRDYYHIIDRYVIKCGPFSDMVSTGIKPYRRDHVAEFLDSLSKNILNFTSVDRFNISYLKDDNWEFSKAETRGNENVLWGLYRKPADFYHFRDKHFDFHLNPVISFGAGQEYGVENRRFRNTRGLQMRGSIDRKIGFYTYLSMNEVRFPSWLDAYIQHKGAIPGEGFWKPYSQEGYSYFSALGHISFPVTKHINAQMGHDRNFVGEGYRSLILSDFSNPYMFLKLNTKIWRLYLTNLWGQMTADVVYNRGRPTDARYPQKWFSHHRLAFDFGHKVNIGVFESVMANSWDWNYLNPVVFYRWVEHGLGSPDKVMLGTDVKWNIVPSMQLYGQFVLDEFLFNEFFGLDGKYSRRNKHALQLGYKYIEVFDLPNLDIQLEYNHARPYTYQEKFEYSAFTNYRTPLTHPRGANFREVLTIIRYQPISRLQLNAAGVYHYFGKDPSVQENYGGDLHKNHNFLNTGMGLFGHRIGQGVKHQVGIASFNASYMVKHNFYLDISRVHRRHIEMNRSSQAINYTQMGIRLNILRHEYHL
ncbi:hypothetical protein [Anditalea andensis]|uniref:Gliding motility protein RemB n=1 Tax=Anditalea andensis TaxID=1048983 RepID=A0A074L0D1_9BACT|nr:hypothetical protein [Anditalea andensis]KEO73333.1 hypothetical protein EL17_13380 [Anditalea andensis]